MRLTTIATALAAWLLLAAAHVPTHAQCAAAREFGGIFGGPSSAKIFIDTTPFQDLDVEYGRIWVSSDSGINGGLELSDPSTCPTQGEFGWWLQGGNVQPPFRGIRGFISTPGCFLTDCPPPDTTLSFLVEDETADKLDAGFILYVVDDTPAAQRWWDHARTEPGASPGDPATHVFAPYPRIVVTDAAAGGGSSIILTVDYTGVADNFHGVIELNGQDLQLTASAGIKGYDVMEYSGLSDPGRFRAKWTLNKSIPYTDAPITDDTIVVDCPDPAFDKFLALGVSFRGGIGDDVPGFFVGSSIQINCGTVLTRPDEEPRSGPQTVQPGPEKRSKLG